MRRIEHGFKTVIVDVLTIVLACFMILFSQMKIYEEEVALPPIRLPDSPKGFEQPGQTSVNCPVVTIKAGEGVKTFFLNQKPVTRNELFEILKGQGIKSLALRGERDAIFKWDEITDLNARLYECGIRKVVYRLKEDMEQ